MMMEVDFHRTGFRASAAQGTRIGKMFPILQPAKVRRNDRTDRTGVSCSVSMSANIAEDRANIQTCAAPDAMERVALLAISQQLCAVIVQQNNVIFFWPIRLARLARAAVQRI